MPKDLRSSDNKHSVKKSIVEVQKRFPDGLPMLDPVKDMHITQVHVHNSIVHNKVIIILLI